MSELVDLTVDWVSLVDRAAVRDPKNAAEPRRLLMFKREGSQLPPNTEGGSMPAATIEELSTQLSKANEAIEKLEARLGKTEEPGESKRNPASSEAGSEKTTAGGDAGEAKKSAKAERKATKKAEAEKAALTKAEREMAERIEKAEREATERIEKAEKAAEEAAEIAKAERDTRVNAEYLVKAEGFQALPIQPAVFGPILKAADEKLSKEESEELNRVLKAADEVLRQSELFKEMGSSFARATSDDPLTEVAEKAETLRKADPKLSKEQAEAQVMKSDPVLQAKYLEKVR